MADDPRALLDEVASEHPRVMREDIGTATSWRVGETAFAVLGDGAAEFRLRDEMVRAALRTPGARASGRGVEWVAFDPPAELERYDVDRLRAWFEMAARLADG